MMKGIKAHFAKRLLRQLIDIATQALYSEQFEMEPLVKRLSRGQSGVALLRAYVAIQTAARLTEPLSDVEMDHALNEVQRCEAYTELPALRELIDVHRELAEHYWSLQHLEILRGKLAYQNDEYSYEGALYNLRSAKKGPVSKAECATFAPICKQLFGLSRQVEQAELKAWKEQDKEEHKRYKEELAARDLSAEADAVETETIRLESAKVVSMLEAKLNALLQKAITAEFTQEPNTMRKEQVDDRKRYEQMAFAFRDLMAAHSPLIGDCSLLPYPKGTLLYAIRWVMDEYEANRETTGTEELRHTYDNLIPTWSYLFTRLARDWQEIDPADKDVIAKLHDCETFPTWALQYKRKYIDNERASNEAAEVALQVRKDRIAQEKPEV